MPGLAGPLTSFWPWRSTEAPDQSGPVPMVHTGTRQCVVITFTYALLILVSVFAMQGMPTTMPRSLGTEVVAPECGR
jgi:hypothetical protein